MKLFKFILILSLIIISTGSFAQGSDQVEMADVLRQDGKIYTVVFGVVAILTVMIILLLRVDKKLFKIEKLIQEKRSGTDK